MREMIPCSEKLRRWIIFLLYLLPSLLSCSRQPVYPGPPIIGSEIVVDIKILKPEVPQFFTYNYQNKRINLFVIKIGDRVLSFLDACSSCYPKRLGYRAESGYIICRACNIRYSISEIENGIGSCIPIKISGVQKDGRYLIPLSELERMGDKF